jgi:hypothetical protein
LPAIRKYRDSARQRHVQAHVRCEHFGSLNRIANFEDFALFLEVDALAAQRTAEIVYMQHAKVVSFYGRIKIFNGLIEWFISVGYVVHVVSFLTIHRITPRIGLRQIQNTGARQIV